MAKLGEFEVAQLIPLADGDFLVLTKKLSYLFSEVEQFYFLEKDVAKEYVENRVKYALINFSMFFNRISIDTPQPGLYFVWP